MLGFDPKIHDLTSIETSNQFVPPTEVEQLEHVCSKIFSYKWGGQRLDVPVFRVTSARHIYFEVRLKKVLGLRNGEGKLFFTIMAEANFFSLLFLGIPEN